MREEYLVKVKIIQSCPTLCDPMDYRPWNSLSQDTGMGGLSLLQGIFPTQGSNPGLPTLQMDSLAAEPQGNLKNTVVGRLFFLQQIFPIQESNWDLLHCRWILSQLSCQGSPFLGKSIPIWGNSKLQRLCNRNMLFPFKAWQEGQGRVS